MAYNHDDFYEGMTEETLELARKLQMYGEFALKNGDAVYQDKHPKELTIRIRTKKKGTTDESKDK